MGASGAELRRQLIAKNTDLNAINFALQINAMKEHQQEKLSLYITVHTQHGSSLGKQGSDQAAVLPRTHVTMAGWYIHRSSPHIKKYILV